MVQNLTIALQNRFDRATAKREVERLLDFVDLTREADKPAGQLGHGQKQWLEIAMAVGVQPSLLLLDEPTAGLRPCWSSPGCPPAMARPVSCRASTSPSGAARSSR